MRSVRALRAESPQISVQMLRSVLDGAPGAPRDVVLFNAGVALYAAGVAPDIADGIKRATQSIDSGAAKAKMDAFVAFTKAAA